jgi:hypothetical protein
MPGRPKDPRRWHPANNRQLWRLNRLGRLKIVNETVCISAAEADAAIRAELEKLGEPCFPDTKVAARFCEAKSAENAEDKTHTG